MRAHAWKIPTVTWIALAGSRSEIGVQWGLLSGTPLAADPCWQIPYAAPLIHHGRLPYRIPLSSAPGVFLVFVSFTHTPPPNPKYIYPSSYIIIPPGWLPPSVQLLLLRGWLQMENQEKATNTPFRRTHRRWPDSISINKVKKIRTWWKLCEKRRASNPLAVHFRENEMRYFFGV